MKNAIPELQTRGKEIWNMQNDGSSLSNEYIWGSNQPNLGKFQKPGNIWERFEDDSLKVLILLILQFLMYYLSKLRQRHFLYNLTPLKCLYSCTYTNYFTFQSRQPRRDHICFRYWRICSWICAISPLSCVNKVFVWLYKQSNENDICKI